MSSHLAEQVCEHLQSRLCLCCFFTVATLLHPSCFYKKKTGFFLLLELYLPHDRWAGKDAPRALGQAARGRAPFAACVQRLRLSSYLLLAQGEKEMKAELPYEIY